MAGLGLADFPLGREAALDQALGAVPRLFGMAGQGLAGPLAAASVSGGWKITVTSIGPAASACQQMRRQLHVAIPGIGGPPPPRHRQAPMAVIGKRHRLHEEAADLGAPKKALLNGSTRDAVARGALRRTAPGCRRP